MWFIAMAWADPVANAVAAGDCKRVLAEAPPEPTWAVPRARCQVKLGKIDDAVATLTPLPTGVMAGYGRLVLAQAHLKAERDGEATAALEGLKLPGAAGDEVIATLAEIYARQGDAAKLIALSVEPAARKSFLLAEAHWNAGRAEAATKLYQQVWRDAAVGGWDATAKDRLGDWTPSLWDTGERLKKLRKNGRIDEAADLSESLGGDQGPPLEQARVNLQARRYKASLEHWERALGAPDKASGGPQSMFDYALTWARTGDYETAAVVYKRVMAAHAGTKQADFASYKLGYMAYDKGDCARATPLFESHLSKFPSSKHATEALWFAARCAWRVDDVDTATKLWNKLLKGYPKSSLAPGAVYWLARARGVQGDKIGENAGLTRVMNSWPLSGYAWFAATRLGKSFPKRPEASRPAWPAALAERKDVKRAETLLAVGLRDWARDELAPVSKVAAGSKAGALAAAWAFLEAGDYRRARKLAKPYCVSPWKEGNPVAQQACTPRPEHAIVDEVARRFDLDAQVPYGIMTAESALKPWVTSRAGARGLMQLMPKEGPRIHTELYPDRPYDADDLYSAPYNASMGTAELGLKRKSLDGVLQDSDLPAVIASYNGGETAVRRWLTAYEGPPEFDEFAEDVGYTETRRYVKRVLGYVMAYRWVYGDPILEAP